jgi:hypothetical protein
MATGDTSTRVDEEVPAGEGILTPFGSARKKSAQDRIPWKRANRMIHSTEERSVETEHRADVIEEFWWLPSRRVRHIRSPP